MYRIDQDQILTPMDTFDPFGLKKTTAFKPNLNNDRIYSQDGWFTVHIYSVMSKRFVPLEENNKESNKLFRLVIPASQKEKIIENLSNMGVNNSTIFPDLEGLCKHINWVHRF